jgi:hypothetical protein
MTVGVADSVAVVRHDLTGRERSLCGAVALTGSASGRLSLAGPVAMRAPRPRCLAMRSERRRRTGSRAPRLVVLLACVGGFFLLAPAGALADLWVSSGGTNAGSCSEASPCASISYAVSRAVPNQTISVGPGTFRDNVSIPASVSPLTIAGAGIHATTVSGGFGPIGSVFTIQDGASASISDVMIEGGTALVGGGVLNQGSLTMEGDDVTGNVAAGAGGGFTALAT